MDLSTIPQEQVIMQTIYAKTAYARGLSVPVVTVTSERLEVFEKQVSQQPAAAGGSPPWFGAHMYAVNSCLGI